MSALTINAWIEKKEPVIDLNSSASGKLIARWHGQAVRQLFEDGVLTQKELCSDDKQQQQQAAHELLLIACANSLCSDKDQQCFNCITGQLLRSYMSAEGAPEQGTPPQHLRGKIASGWN